MEHIDRVKGRKTGELYRLMREGNHNVGELAAILETSQATVRVLQTRLRRYGLLPPSAYHQKTEKPVCPTCQGKKFIPVKEGDRVTHTRCPDCNAAR